MRSKKCPDEEGIETFLSSLLNFLISMCSKKCPDEEGIETFSCAFFS